MSISNPPHATERSANDFPRRRFLRCFAGVAASGWLLLQNGCRPNAVSSDGAESDSVQNGASNNSVAKVSTVPLRLLSTASDAFNQRLANSWQAVSEQPLEITPIAPADLAGRANQSDVILCQNQSMGDLQSVAAFATLPTSLLESQSVSEATFLRALASDTMRWGDERFALPLGTAVPSAWTSTEREWGSLENWDDYQQAISKLSPGEAAEPLAEGWAGLSFLVRASTLTGGTWLFDRQSFQPVLTAPPFVRALEQLVESSKSYPAERLTPGEVWTQLVQGKLKAAITWPVGENTNDSAASAFLQMHPLPLGKEVYIDAWQPRAVAPSIPFAMPGGLIVGISASCRQSGAARSLVSWMVSTDGNSALRGAENELLAIRRTDLGDESSQNESGQVWAGASPLLIAYDQLLVSHLGAASIRPTLRIVRAGEYMQILDREVRKAVSGEVASEAALAQVTMEWEKLTDEVGRLKQANGWRKSQGMRGR